MTGSIQFGVEVVRVHRAERGTTRSATTVHGRNFIGAIVKGAFRQPEWVSLRRMDQPTFLESR